ncbi:thiamine-phosphate kinase [Guptibacillus algicola]|uniref:thiamine-phosphate kinase n=1 Tax=Guptibacillus algicola TaxID=225844 RepID=UPI001CD4D12D|nr:thiamine-phosphate kinase [Alkalihalobacillus algicola]MCA0989629.1 thiamine-phosphate kinase [Alkalihalobacillus algicola]
MKDEFDFIRSITPAYTKREELIEGIGDDAALYRVDSRWDEIACVDTMVEGVHFTKNTMSPEQVGRKALAVNISDIAAMGGMPLFYLVSISIPKSGWSEEELKQVYRGLHAVGTEHEMDMIGGDTVSARDEFTLSVTVIGKVERGRKLLRKNAEPGDVVFLTGTVGGSAAGLSYLLNETTQENANKPSFLSAHQTPVPHVKAGRILSRSGYRISLNDVSDGIASEANEIAEASHVSIVLKEEELPSPEGFDAYSSEQRLDWMLYGGEDFVLIGTVSEENWPHVEKMFKSQDEPIYKIGFVKEGNCQVYLMNKENKYILDKKGFNHFSSEE